MKRIDLKQHRLENYMCLEFMSRSENVGLARLAAAGFASQLPYTLSEIEEIKVAISEAVSNCVIHAYARQSDKIIRIQAGISAEKLEFVVEDWGCGIQDVAQARKPSVSSDPERMGLGFVFMESFMDFVEIESEPGQGTRVYLAKNKPVEEEPDARTASKGDPD